jgi:hypothetical protein
MPQYDWHPWPNMDYTFFHTNQDCLPLALPHAMQFGSTLQCIVQCLVYCNPELGPPLMAKIDLPDGYYQVPLAYIHSALQDWLTLAKNGHRTSSSLAFSCSLHPHMFSSHRRIKVGHGWLLHYSHPQTPPWAQ